MRQADEQMRAQNSENHQDDAEGTREKEQRRKQRQTAEDKDTRSQNEG